MVKDRAAEPVQPGRVSEINTSRAVEKDKW